MARAIVTALRRWRDQPRGRRVNAAFKVFSREGLAQ
jgi:hypothetical protein